MSQIKASDTLKRDRSASSFPFPIDRRDLVSWLAQPMPVILAVYDAANATVPPAASNPVMTRSPPTTHFGSAPATGSTR